MIGKTCKDCGIEKPLDEYYKHPGMVDGHLNSCKVCRIKYWKNRPKEAIRRIERKRSQKPVRILFQTKNTKKWRADNPGKARAHNVVSNALRDGKIFRGACEVCGSDQNIHGHHEDYSEPLQVRWLCAACHFGVHREEAGGSR